MPQLTESDALSTDTLARVEAALAASCGLALTQGQRRAFPEAVRAAASGCGVSPAQLAERVLDGDEPALEALVARAVVGETCFFRHADQLEALRGLLPSLDRGDPLLFWSAGCASGEEAWSVAMLLLEEGREADRVVATDVSDEALAQARSGRYGHWSARRLDGARRERWFRAAGHELEVVPALRPRVEFRRHNLVHDAPPWTFDVVLCRNVLIYFAPATAAEVLRRLASAVRPGGLLVLGPVELPMAASLPFAWEDHGGVTFLRRPEHDAEAASRPAGRRPAGRPSAAPAALGPLFLAARHLAQLGALTDAERLARAAADAEGGPEPWLLLAQLAEARGEVEVALAEVGRALEVEPALPVGHAARAALLRRLGQPALAGMARADALHALEGAPDDLPLRAVEPVAAGALRRALAGGTPDDA